MHILEEVFADVQFRVYQHTNWYLIIIAFSLLSTIADLLPLQELLRIL